MILLFKVHLSLQLNQCLNAYFWSDMVKLLIQEVTVQSFMVRWMYR